MKFASRLSGSLALVAGTVLLASCGGGGGSGSGTGMGSLTVSLTDGPVEDASNVVIVFTGLELQRSNGDRVDIDFGMTGGQPVRKSIDVLALQHGVTSDLTQGSSVPAGDYNWMRLKVLATPNSQDESYIKLLNGNQYPLWIPSGAETGLKLVRPFTVAQGSITRLVVDFDLRKSVTAPPGQAPNYIMRPALRLVDHLQVGQITANVDLAALAAAQLPANSPVTSCDAGLYLFAGGAATPDDQDGDATDGADPILYEPVTNDGVNTNVSLDIPFVEAGTYTLAATCDFGVDVADANDYNPGAMSGQPGFQTMRWSTVGNVTVTANMTTTVAVP